MIGSAEQYEIENSRIIARKIKISDKNVIDLHSALKKLTCYDVKDLLSTELFKLRPGVCMLSKRKLFFTNDFVNMPL